jgi:large subunit ribosomal protein L23
MALLDVFKKKKPEKKKAEAKPRPVKPETKAPKTVKKRKTERSYRILKSLHVTEKATALTGKNQYIFRVFSDANKNEIKKSVEDLYGVDVASVRIINVPRRKRRLGRIKGFRKGYKKAVVKIKEGQKIEVLPR